jgi:hypothetical protein
MDPYTVPELDITFSAGAWTTDEQFAAAGCPGLAPLPEGYVYANQSTEAQPQPQPT